ncbi:hypothetical protein K431DRAFT_323732 [Polychaeton citri CBS 116435]|uniref:CENP-V/GFA domain-containing protein n=1 Tax=Polychaeton citri CBS 116435 TaxID=1314669 RepID=A0A9P4UL46_9PEZI|nr:hypothetical protein K431DRAFT_323732 [Polychaeton citri CBS 116435]
MLEGDCLCDTVRINSFGTAQGKITGSTYSTNVIVPGNGFSVTKGKLKEFSEKADSGKTIVSYSCSDSKALSDVSIIKVGMIDNASTLDNAKPVVELLAAQRVSWVHAITGAEQK